jgi:acyl carrier protein
MNTPTASRRTRLHAILSSCTERIIPIELKDKLTVDLGMDSLDLVEAIVAISDEFDIDKPKIATGEDILALLDRELGPAEPTNGQLHLTEDQFIARYRPEQTPDGGYYRQRDWTVPDDVLMIDIANIEGRLWTAVDDDNGEFAICSGKHYVNRLYYIITARPPEDRGWMIDVQDPDESPRVLLKVDWDLTNDDDNPNTEGVDVVGPPEQVVVRLYDVATGLQDAMDDQDAVAAWLSDEHGFCHNSWSVVRALAPGEEVPE